MQVYHIIGAVLLLAGGTFIGTQLQNWQCKSSNEPPQRCVLRTVMRKLWADHVMWTREYIIAAVAGTPDAKDVATRLLRNQEDIGNAIVPYYGADAGKKLTELLKDHILIAVDVVAAAKENKKNALEESNKRWHNNAEEIAQFLSSANPNWPVKVLKSMLYEHLKVTTNEAVAHIKKEWVKSITIFDTVFSQAMEMADSLSDGIIKQFSNKF